MSVVYLIQTSLYLGFGAFTMLTVLLSLTNDKGIENLNNKIIEPSLILIRWIGILFICYWISLILFNESFIERLNGNYRYTIYVPILIYGILPQVFWIKIFKQNLFLKFLIALMLFTLSNFERFIIILTSFHQDYFDSNLFNVSFFKSLGIEVFFAIAFHSFLVTLMILFRKKDVLNSRY